MNAQSLVMVGTPSEAARQLVHLICKKEEPLTECCCATAVSAIWRNLLPAQVRAHVANMDLKTDFEGTITSADNVWRSLKGSSGAVAAVTAENKPKGEAESADVAAYTANKTSRGGQRSRGYRRGRGRGRADGQKQEETPPEGCCPTHKKYGKKAFYYHLIPINLQNHYMKKV